MPDLDSFASGVGDAARPVGFPALRARARRRRRRRQVTAVTAAGVAVVAVALGSTLGAGVHTTAPTTLPTLPTPGPPAPDHPCRPDELTADPLPPGGGAGGTYSIPVHLTAHGTGCTLTPGTLTLRHDSTTLARLEVTLANGDHSLRLPPEKTAMLYASTPDEPSACGKTHLDSEVGGEQDLGVYAGDTLVTQGREAVGVCPDDWSLHVAGGDPFYLIPHRHR